MPRIMLRSAFEFLCPMSEWETRIGKSATENEKTQNEEEDDAGFMAFGGCDDDDVEGAVDEADRVPSHFLALTSCSQIFNVLTPLVTMSKTLEPIHEKELSLFKLTPTLNFTLSLNVEFNSAIENVDALDASSVKLFDTLNQIRFLRELKINGNRTSISEIKEIAKLRFLESLDLSGISRFTDDKLQHLHGLNSLKSLNLSGWSRLTSKGLAHVPQIAPFLNTLILRKNTNLKKDCFDSFLKHPTILKSLRHLSISEALWFNLDCIKNVLSKFGNLESVQFHSCTGLDHECIIELAKSCSKLLSIECIDMFLYTDDAKITKGIGKVLGPTLRRLRLHASPRFRLIAPGFERKPAAQLKYLVRYFDALEDFYSNSFVQILDSAENVIPEVDMNDLRPYFFVGYDEEYTKSAYYSRLAKRDSISGQKLDFLIREITAGNVKVEKDIDDDYNTEIEAVVYTEEETDDEDDDEN